MEINVSQIIEQKLAAMESDGSIKKKIEDALEKAVLGAVSCEIDSYEFRRGIQDQLKDAVSSVAADCGLRAYNGFIAQRCRDIVANLISADMGDRVQKQIDDVMFTKYENIRLSDIFKRYRAWVLDNTEESDKYERGEFTHELETKEDGNWTRYICRFADHKLENVGFSLQEDPDIEIQFSCYRKDAECAIGMLYIDGHYMKDSFKLGYLTEFESFVLNLYYNGTKILMDADDVEEDPYFDVDI